MTDCPHRQVSLDWTDPAARLVGEPPCVEAASGWCVTCGRQVWGTEARHPVEAPTRAPASPEPSPLMCTDVDWLGWAEGVPCQRAATHSNTGGAAVCPAHRIRGDRPLPGPIPLSERCHYTLPDGRFCVGYRGHSGWHEAAPRALYLGMEWP